jgi:hypothetical protein
MEVSRVQDVRSTVRMPRIPHDAPPIEPVPAAEPPLTDPALADLGLTDLGLTELGLTDQGPADPALIESPLGGTRSIGTAPVEPVGSDLADFGALEPQLEPEGRPGAGVARGHGRGLGIDDEPDLDFAAQDGVLDFPELPATLRLADPDRPRPSTSAARGVHEESRGDGVRRADRRGVHEESRGDGVRRADRRGVHEESRGDGVRRADRRRKTGRRGLGIAVTSGCAGVVVCAFLLMGNNSGASGGSIPSGIASSHSAIRSTNPGQVNIPVTSAAASSLGATSASPSPSPSPSPSRSKAVPSTAPASSAASSPTPSASSTHTKSPGPGPTHCFLFFCS